LGKTDYGYLLQATSLRASAEALASLQWSETSHCHIDRLDTEYTAELQWCQVNSLTTL